MHIHGNQSNLNAVNPYTAAAERAVATRRAANVSKRLMKAAGEVGGGGSAEETLMVGRWLDSSEGHSQEESEYHPSEQG
jgi:hypothetical protein